MFRKSILYNKYEIFTNKGLSLFSLIVTYESNMLNILDNLKIQYNLIYLKIFIFVLSIDQKSNKKWYT